MSQETQLFIGLRKQNGQIGYLSESLSIPDFFELVRPESDNSNNSYLVDFSPVVEVLHKLHKEGIERSILEDYNSVFNYWQDSKTYTKLEILLPKFENLSLLSNKLINRLQLKITDKKSQIHHRRSDAGQNRLSLVRDIEKDVNAYLDTLLCFVHSKASLDIDSFLNDTMLTQYCDFLKVLLSDLLEGVLEYDSHKDWFYDSSFMFNLILFNNDEARTYIPLLSQNLQHVNLLAKVVDKFNVENHYEECSEHNRSIRFSYRAPSNQELNGAEIIRNMCYKVNSLAKLIQRLKQGNVTWHSSEETTKNLKELITLKNI